MQSKYVCLALVAPMTMVLHGCGGGDSTTTSAPGPSPAPSPSPGPGPTPAPVPPMGPTPWAPDDAVRILNSLYMNFDENNDDSHLGVTISMAGQRDKFDSNLFCAELGTQCRADGTPSECFSGQADCRMSSSLFNHKVMVNGTSLIPTMGRPIGYIFNQDLTETHWGKCAFIWDGADSSNLNNGCGAGATSGNCYDPHSAFQNQCSTQPPEFHNCTRDDPEVASRLCKCEAPFCSESYGVVEPPAGKSGETCFYEMPALIYNDSTTTNHLRDSVKQRVLNQGDDPALTGEWNEVVIDNRLLIPKIREEPANAIWAFLCIHPSTEFPTACEEAVAMRDEFQTAYNVQGGTIPVVAMDPTADFSVAGGPFKEPPASQIIA